MTAQLPRHHSPAVTPLGQQLLRIYIEGRNSTCNVRYFFNSNSWEIIIWKVCPQSKETFLKLQSCTAGRSLLASSTGTILHSGAHSLQDAPGIPSSKDKQLRQSWLTSRWSWQILQVMWVISKPEVKQSQYSGTLFPAWMPLIEIREVSTPNNFCFCTQCGCYNSKQTI